MLIGVPKEGKNHQDPGGLAPGSVRGLIHHGHKGVVEASGGAGVGGEDTSYEDAGASIARSAGEVFATAELVVKVKEPQAQEVAILRRGQVLFTYLHLAADKGLTEGLSQTGAIAVAYETVTDPVGGL